MAAGAGEPLFRLSPSRVARYFFHECDRYLRFAAATSPTREAEGIPSPEADRSLLTRAILEGGYAWEEKLLAEHLADRAIVPDAEPGRPDAPLHERRFSSADTLARLAAAESGEVLYQGTLSASPAFYDAYALDPTLVSFVDCHPDLLFVDEAEDGRMLVTVVDAKASEMMKLSHRIQVGLYTLLLQHALTEAGLDDELTTGRDGGVWLNNQPEPEWFDLSRVLPPLETFLVHDLTPLLDKPADEAFWHLYFRCEWCDFYHHCRAEADRNHDVSLVPYLSTFAKRHLATHDVHTIDDFADLLHGESAPEVLAGCGSLEGKTRQLRLAVHALRTGNEAPTGSASVGMPKGEHIRILLTVQSEPLTGALYGYALNRTGGNDLLGADREDRTVARVAAEGDPDTLAALRADLVRDLIAWLRPVHVHNQANSENWRAQKTVQAYVFDSYERELLVEALLLEAQGGPVQNEALALLFWFQHPDLASADDHPASEVFFPLIVLTEVVRRLMALPVPVVYRLADVNAALQPSDYGFTYHHNDFHGFELSNRMKSNAIFEVWNRGRADLLDGIERELKSRVWAANSVINGLRERLEGTGALFAWPPKFELPAGLGFTEPLLSRLAFLARYEAMLGYLEVRTKRAAPVEDLLNGSTTLLLTRRDDGLWSLDPRQADADIDLGDFWSWILTVDDDAGRRARLAYDDFRFRRAMWPPKHAPVALARITDLADDGSLELELRTGASWTEPGRSATALLDARFTDYLTDAALTELHALDREPDPWFLQLLTDPLAARSALKVSAAGRASALDRAEAMGMTPSQLEAFAGVVDHDVQLVWGPPGTGKTHFLAGTILCLAEAHRLAGRPFRVLVVGFTHPSINNVLAKIGELQNDHRVVQGDIAMRKLARGADSSAPVEVLQPDAAADFARQHPILVYGATVWQARKVEPSKLSYDLVVVDEGSQLKVWEAAIAVRRVRHPGGRLVIAGDDQQLPPIVKGDYPEQEGEPRLHRSILEALRDLGEAGGPPAATTRRRQKVRPLTLPLLENWRMCDRLCEYPSASLYPADYAPATPAIAGRRLTLSDAPEDELAQLLLDPEFPVVVAVFDDVQATRENPAEADLVATLVSEMRRLTPGSVDDAEFWAERVFVVSPHHLQNRLIRRRVASRRAWGSPPFVDTVDKMQGQECDLVIVSYGVSDVEYALSEKEFIYSRNRLNVAITRARAKTVVLLSRQLLEPPLQALDRDGVADGIAYMQGWARWCEEQSDPVVVKTDDGVLTVYRG